MRSSSIFHLFIPLVGTDCSTGKSKLTTPSPTAAFFPRLILATAAVPSVIRNTRLLFLSPSCGFISGLVKLTNFARRRSFRCFMLSEHSWSSHLAGVSPEKHGRDSLWRRFCFLSRRSRLKLAVQSLVTQIFRWVSSILQQSGAFSAPLNLRTIPFSAFTPAASHCCHG